MGCERERTGKISQEKESWFVGLTLMNGINVFRRYRGQPFSFDQGNKCDFAGAVKTQGDAGSTGAPTGVAGHFLVLPCSGGGITRRSGVSEDGALILQADLSAVGVAAKVEIGVTL